MKKLTYILNRDLPDHPAGTELEYDTVFSDCYSTPNPKNTSTLVLRLDELQRAIETGWVKEVEERKTVYQQKFDDGDAFFIIQDDMKKFTPEEITLMEKALNGELMEKVDLQEFAKWYESNDVDYDSFHFNHAELLEAFNNREK